MSKEEGYTVTRKEEEEHLLKRSRGFLETAEYQKSKGFFDLATFSLEQALQLFLKAKVLAEGVDYPRTHSVRVLLEILSDLVPENKKSAVKGILENYLLELGMLEGGMVPGLIDGLGEGPIAAAFLQADLLIADNSLTAVTSAGGGQHVFKGSDKGFG